ncbi:hypothetical protein GDR29_15750 [Xanthomonas oryzae pv. oryzae]|nr:hypothetical protein GDR29_15750 [Xanthomonas oryzae pv. oryzae]
MVGKCLCKIEHRWPYVISGMPSFLNERGGIHTQLRCRSAAHLGVFDKHILVHGQHLRRQRVLG